MRAIAAVAPLPPRRGVDTGAASRRVGAVTRRDAVEPPRRGRRGGAARRRSATDKCPKGRGEAAVWYELPCPCKRSVRHCVCHHFVALRAVTRSAVTRSAVAARAGVGSAGQTDFGMRARRVTESRDRIA
jgi:hypothetical protein